MASLKRISKASTVDHNESEGQVVNNWQEYAEVTSNPPAGITVAFVDEADVHKWNITMDGPEGSPYVVCRLISHLNI
jgi:hypothetical protein